METAFSILGQRGSVTANAHICTILAHPSANLNELIFLFMLANPIEQILP